MKKAFIPILFLLMASFVSALVTVEKSDKIPVIFKELNNPGYYELTIQNNGAEDNFQIYNLVGVTFMPREKFTIPSGTETLNLQATLPTNLLKNNGFITFDYYLKGDKSDLFKDQLLMKIISFSEAIDISASPVLPNDANVKLRIKNKENTEIKDLQVNFDSAFFSESRTISLTPYEEIQIQIPITKKINTLLAGPYILKSEATLENGKKISFESLIDYQEKHGISVDEKNFGFIIKETAITKTNKGNTPVTASISLKKDAISRLFTINSPSPTTSERSGFSVTYTWQKNLAPSEALEANSTTNYTIPLIIIILSAIVGVFAKIYSQTSLIVNKKVSFVRTKSGDLALKVNLRIKARKNVNKIQIIDTLPGMTKLYEKFGRMPDRVDQTSRRLFWNIPTLNAGEERLFSYIIYSKLKVVGKFELPAATAVFEHEGKTQEAWSNRTFFISGQTV